MIDLTPLEVRKKKGDFRRQLRGYEPAQVDDFLDVVADRLEALVRENLSLTERVTRLEQQVADYRDRERALTEALVTAQEMREEMRTQTTREVELAKRQALQDAERIRAEAVQEREREEDNLRRLRQRQRQVLQSFRTFLEREVAELVVFSTALEMEDEAAPMDRAGSRSRRAAPPNPLDAVAGLAAASHLTAPDVPQASKPPVPEAPSAGPPEPIARTWQAPAERAVEAGQDASPAASPEPTARTWQPPAEPRGEAAAPEPAAPPKPGPLEEPFAPPPVDEARTPPAAGGGAALDPFGDLLSEPSDVARLDDLADVDDRPEPVGGLGNPFEEPEPEEPRVGPMTDDDLGELFASWDEPRSRAAEPPAEPLQDEVATPADEMDDLMLSEAELFLSDADVLEEPAEGDDDIAALERVEGGDDEWLLDEDLLFGGGGEKETPSRTTDAPSEGIPPAPTDQPVDLSLLPDDELQGLSIDDLGLPPLGSSDADDDDRGFGPSGLTLRPLSSDTDAPEAAREGRDEDDDEDMFSTLFGKPR